MVKPKSRKSAGGADELVGNRIREWRLTVGLTQQQFADMIGVSYQQAHKYECGINALSAGRLYEIARVLNAPITYFYEAIGEKTPRPLAPRQRMLIDFARSLAEIENEKHREVIGHLTRVLAGH